MPVFTICHFICVVACTYSHVLVSIVYWPEEDCAITVETLLKEKKNFVVRILPRHMSLQSYIKYKKLLNFKRWCSSPSLPLYMYLHRQYIDATCMITDLIAGFGKKLARTTLYYYAKKYTNKYKKYFPKM